MVKLCTFGEAVNCIDAGGAAYRYGRMYPIYYKGGILYEYYQPQYMNTRCVNVGFNASTQYVARPMFNHDDMVAIDWVKMPKKKWEEFQKKRQADIEKLYEDIRKRNEEDYKKQREAEANNVIDANNIIDTANTVMNPSFYKMTWESKPWWKRWFYE